MRRSRGIALFVTALAATGCYRGPLTRPIFSNGESYSWKELPGADVDHRLLMDWSAGDPLPAGVESVEWGGRTKYTQLGPRAWLVTIEDDADDLVSATIHINGIPWRKATRANGRIVDRSDFAQASLAFGVPAWGDFYGVKLSWTGADGSTNSTSGPLRRPGERF